MMEDRTTLSVPQIAELCNVSPSTVAYWIRTSALPAHRIGRTYAISSKQLVRFLKKKGRQVPATLIGESTVSLFGRDHLTLAGSFFRVLLRKKSVKAV